MGAFLSGLLGAAGDDLKQQSLQKHADEIRRQQLRLDILRNAASSPNVRPESLPEIFRQMDEIAGEMPGQKKGGGKGGKKQGRFSQMGQMLGTLMGHGDGGGQGAPGGSIATPPFLPPGMTAGSAPAAAPPAPSPAMAGGGGTAGMDVPAVAGAGAAPAPVAPPALASMPQTKFGGMFYTEPELEGIEERAGKRKTARELEAYKGKGAADLQMSNEEFESKMGRVSKLQSALNIPQDEAMAAIFGTAAKGKTLEVTGALGDEYGYPGKTGKLFIHPDGRREFVPATGKEAGAGAVVQVTRGGHKLLYSKTGQFIADLGRIDEPLSWKPMQKGNEIWYVPYSTRTHAPLGPAVPNMPEGAEGGGTAPKALAAGPPATRGGAPAAAGVKGAGMPPTQFGGGTTRPAGIPAGARYGGEKFSTQQKQMMERAETAMQTGVEAIEDLRTLSQQHPDWFGPMAGRWTEVKNKIGFAPEGIRDLIAKIHSVQNFLPSLHGLRGKYPLEAWERVLRDPFVNPAATADAIRGALNAAEVYRKTIQKGDFQSDVTVKGIERSRGMTEPPATRLNPYR